jgi:N-acetylmuramoyl-L-alanine amidase
MNKPTDAQSETLDFVESCEQINRVSNDPEQIARSGAVPRAASLKVQDINPNVHGCSTAIVHGLSMQLIEELNKVVPNALTSFADLNVDLGDAAYPFLQPPAVEALKRALARRPGRKMFVNSAYRTIAQQLLLYNQGQNGQCGIGEVAPPGGSNHQSGLALDIEDGQNWLDALETEGWRWFGPKDRPHFDYVGGGTKDIRQAAILAFQVLWDRHNPGDSINDGGFYGPQTEDRLNRSPVNGFGGFTPTPLTGATPRVLELQTPLMKGDDVIQVQKALIKAGFNLGENGADGLYGMATANAVKQFQQQGGLTVDGRVGPATRKALGIT